MNSREKIANHPITLIIKEEFERYGVPLQFNYSLLPPGASTLFTIAGMQMFKDFYKMESPEKKGSIQACIRTPDFSQIGDGKHLTLFHMVGNFAFSKTTNDDYEKSAELWDRILKRTNLPVTHITAHPSQTEHAKLWKKLGYEVIEDSSCVWTDGETGGFCCEVFSGEIEIGNLVNPNTTGVDVGFGLERMVQLFEDKHRIDETSLFDQSLAPESRDLARTLENLYLEKISPGAKGSNSIVRQLVRKFIPLHTAGFIFDEWVNSEKQLLEKKFEVAARYLRKNPKAIGNSAEWWNSTFGITYNEYINLTNHLKV